jgi:N-sulfoglucosamine sulfohydrolase
MKAWRKLNGEGKLNDVQKLFFAERKPKEELYDCEADPHEVKNLAALPEHQAKRKELSGELDRWMKEVKDLGEFSEKELVQKGIVKDILPEYFERIKKHPEWSKASPLPPGK